MIDMLVGRCHVGESNRAVIRYVKSRFKKGAWKKLGREKRKEIMRAVIESHKANRALYSAVMTGRF
jgi:hypothetical protein